MRLGDGRGISDGRLRFQPSQGPALVRNAGKVPKPMRRSMRLTGTQLQTFEAWWDGDLNGGALAFTHTDPVDDATVNVRIVSVDAAQAVVGSVPAGDRRWTLSMTLEIMP
jgi:hypothetical protein